MVNADLSIDGIRDVLPRTLVEDNAIQSLSTGFLYRVGFKKQNWFMLVNSDRSSIDTWLCPSFNSLFQFSLDPLRFWAFLPVYIVWCWLMLVGADWCWQMLIDVDWCWLILIDADWCWLMLIDSDWCRLILIDAYWCWLILINVDWCWLMLIDSNWCWCIHSKSEQIGEDYFSMFNVIFLGVY